jgi:hypothetical protein
MPLYVYKIENFNLVRPKELDQFKTFASILYKEFHNAEDTCLFISNFAIPGNKKRSTTPVDGILITPKCIAVIDFKAYSGIITAKLNGSWIFQENENSKEIPIDGGSGTKTVLGQITINHDALAEYLKELSKEIEIKENSFNYKSVSCIVAFIDIIKLNNEIGDGLPFGLGICDSNSFKETLDRLHKETSRRLHRSKLLTNDEIDKIRLKLNISSCLMQESEYKDYKSKYSKQTEKSTENSHNINTAKSSSKKDAPKPEHPQRTNIEHRPVESEEDSNRQQRTITSDSNAVKPIQPINQRPAQTSDTLQRPTTTANSTANAPIRPSTQQQPNPVRSVTQPTHQLGKPAHKPHATTVQKETARPDVNTQNSKTTKSPNEYRNGKRPSILDFVNRTIIGNTIVGILGLLFNYVLFFLVIGLESTWYTILAVIAIPLLFMIAETLFRAMRSYYDIGRGYNICVYGLLSFFSGLIPHVLLGLLEGLIQMLTINLDVNNATYLRAVVFILASIVINVRVYIEYKD